MIKKIQNKLFFIKTPRLNKRKDRNEIPTVPEPLVCNSFLYPDPPKPKVTTSSLLDLFFPVKALIKQREQVKQARLEKEKLITAERVLIQEQEKEAERKRQIALEYQKELERQAIITKELKLQQKTTLEYAPIRKQQKELTLSQQAKIQAEKARQRTRALNREFEDTQKALNEFTQLIAKSEDSEQKEILHNFTEKFNLLKAAKEKFFKPIRELKYNIVSEIMREKMMLELETQFTKGAAHYRPCNHISRGTVPFDLNSIRDIIPDNDHPYREELKRMSLLFCENSAKIEPALIDFNTLSNQYFSEAAQSINEIFDLQKDTTLKWLERIPKLGIIPKALRVGEQIRLTRCVMKDYQAVSDKYLTHGIIPLINKYNGQYETIRNYVDEHKKGGFWNKKFTEKVLNMVKNTKKQRFETNAKILNLYSRSGMNLSNICKNIKNKSLFDLAAKTARTFLSLC